MAHKRYNIRDDAYLQLQTGISASTTTLNVVKPTEYDWIQDMPADNWIATLVQYKVDGNPKKKEKVYVRSTNGSVLTVERGYLGDTPQTFNAGDYVFLNIVAEHIDDIHTRIDEVETNKQNQLDDIYSQGDHRLRVYRIKGDPALQVRIGAGTYNSGGAIGLYTGGSLLLQDNVTSYIMIDGSGVIQVDTSEFDENFVQLGKVITSTGSVQSIELYKADAIGGKFGGNLVFQDTRNTGTTPNSYNDTTFKVQFKNLISIGLDGLADGIYCKLVGFRGWNDDSGGDAIETAYCDNGRIFYRWGANTTWGNWVEQRKIWDGVGALPTGNYGTGVQFNVGGFLHVSIRGVYSNSYVNHYLSPDGVQWTLACNVASVPDDISSTSTIAIPAGYYYKYSGLNTSVSINSFIPLLQ